ncbi:hypothetical protein LBMAG36_07590 [Chlorobiota bacterium]|nr:hypothetical protein LBMAG36_07590 [Chlorobiota bacterium]
MKRVMFFGILCLLISCLSVHHSVCYAQVKAAIWIDSTNKNADTLDYDILFFKDSPKILNFYMENLGKGDIWIKDGFAPNFVLESDKANPEQFREFYPDNIIFPFTITENSKPKAFPIRFKPVIDTSGDDRLGIKTAKIQLTLSNIDTTDTTSYTRYFYVRGWKTKDFLAKRDTLINFDSVLVGQYNPPTQWNLRNVSKADLTVSKTSIDTYIDSSSISISQNPNKIVNPNGLYSVDIDYQPQKLGWDSAKVTTYYSPNIDNVADSNSVIIKGFGVKHDALISRLSQGKSGIPITVDANFRGINVDSINVGKLSEVEVVFENTGNIPIHAKLILKEFAPKGPSYSSLDTGKIIIIPANSKTAKITLFVKPQESGDINCTLELHTDIRSRVRNSPTDSIIRFDIKGIGQAPVLIKDQVAIEFEDIVVPSEQNNVCDSISKIRTIKITNTGNLLLEVSTPEFLSPVGKGDYDISPKSKLTIEPNKSQSYLLSFLPKSKTSGISKDTLIFISNSVRDANAKLPQRDTVFLSGNGIVPDSISLSIGKVKSAPSKKVLIPIYIDSGSKSLIYSSSFKTSIQFDSTYAFRFDTVYTEGTATANSNISITKKTLGSSIQIELDIKSKSNSFIDNPILANLVYDTYIAAPGSVDIIIKHDINQIKNPTQFGRGDCPNFFKVNPPISGSFTLDSVCGEGYKGVHNAKGGFTFDVYQAMNHSEQALIHCSSPYDMPSKIIICSVQGGELLELYNGQMISNEQISFPFSTEFLSPGIYFCIFKAGIYTSCKPLIINR